MIDDRDNLDRVVEKFAPWVRPATVQGGEFDGARTYENIDASIGVCDFCSEQMRDGSKEYAATDEIVKSIDPPVVGKKTTLVSLGDWGACGPCAELIDIDARDRLLKRIFDLRLGAFDNEVPPHKREEVRGRQRDILRRTVAAFYRARTT